MSLSQKIVLSSIFKDSLLDVAVWKHYFFSKCSEKQRIEANHIWFIGENLERKYSTERGMIQLDAKKEFFWDEGTGTM